MRFQQNKIVRNEKLWNNPLFIKYIGVGLYEVIPLLSYPYVILFTPKTKLIWQKKS